MCEVNKVALKCTELMTDFFLFTFQSGYSFDSWVHDGIFHTWCSAHFNLI